MEESMKPPVIINTNNTVKNQTITHDEINKTSNTISKIFIFITNDCGPCTIIQDGPTYKHRWQSSPYLVSYRTQWNFHF